MVMTVESRIWTGSKSLPSDISQPNASVCLIVYCSFFKRLTKNRKCMKIPANSANLTVIGKAQAMLAPNASACITTSSRINRLEGLSSTSNVASVFFGKLGRSCAISGQCRAFQCNTNSCTDFLSLFKQRYNQLTLKLIILFIDES
jgi:hypothetical protein